MVTTQPPPITVSDSFTKKKKRTGDSCRLYKARTTLVVQRATSTVSELCSVKIEQPSFKGLTCTSLYKEVKSFLSLEVSSEPEVQLAFQSIKKLLPDACSCMHGSMLADLKSRLSRPPPRLPSGYLAFCREIVKEIFPTGWDKGWKSKTETFSPSLGSCVGSGRAAGGQLSALATQGQDAWVQGLTTLKPKLRGELLLVNSSGKPRPLTRFEADSSDLRPLHGLIYDKLSEQPWLLRGDVTAEKLHEAGFRADGASLISGDYVSASDNLPIEVAELILDVIWSSSRFIPSSVLRFALAAQRPELAFEGPDHLRDTFVPTIGQMMGSYLCFPLLCLQNYLAFRWGESVAGLNGTPVLINGDDILFQEDEEFYNLWVDTIVGVGFEVERTKTSISHDWGTINSTLLRKKSGSVVPVKTFRMGMLRRAEHPSGLGASFRTFSRVGPRRFWFRNGCAFLRHHIYLLRWGCVAQDMGFYGRLARKVWKYCFRGALWVRESELRLSSDLPSLEPVPSPHSIVMASDEFQSFPAELINQEVVKGIGRWMAARKWQLGKTFVRVKPKKLLTERQSKILHLPKFFFGKISGLIKSVKTYCRFPGVAPKTHLPFGPSGEMARLRDVSVWVRPPRVTDVRVPIPLLEEFGLAPHGCGVDEVVGRCDPSLFGIGERMLFNSAFKRACALKVLAEEGIFPL